MFLEKCFPGNIKWTEYTPIFMKIYFYSHEYTLSTKQWNELQFPAWNLNSLQLSYQSPFVCLGATLHVHFDGLVQDCIISSALAVEILQSCDRSDIFNNRNMTETLMQLKSDRITSLVCWSLFETEAQKGSAEPAGRSEPIHQSTMTMFYNNLKPISWFKNDGR